MIGRQRIAEHIEVHLTETEMNWPYPPLPCSKKHNFPGLGLKVPAGENGPRDFDRSGFEF